MIKIDALAKSFAISRGQKLSDSEKQDVRYSKEAFHSVRNVSFDCGSGEVLGLLGPNGAGKTTTLRILSTALQPDSGSVLIEGVDVLKQPVQAQPLYKSRDDRSTFRTATNTPVAKGVGPAYIKPSSVQPKAAGVVNRGGFGAQAAKRSSSASSFGG